MWPPKWMMHRLTFCLPLCLCVSASNYYCAILVSLLLSGFLVEVAYGSPEVYWAHWGLKCSWLQHGFVKFLASRSYYTATSHPLVYLDCLQETKVMGSIYFDSYQVQFLCKAWMLLFVWSFVNMLAQLARLCVKVLAAFGGCKLKQQVCCIAGCHVICQSSFVRATCWD